MRSDKRVVITGCGLVTSIGDTAERSWQALLGGASGRREATRFDINRYAPRFVCALPPSAETEADGAFPLDAASRVLLAAAGEALQGYGEDAWRDAPAYVATTLGGMDNGTHFYRSYLQHGLAGADRARLKDYIPFMQCRHLMQRHGFGRMPMIVTNACSSGANALGLAMMEIRQGHARRAVAAGYDIVSEFVFGGFNALRLIDPEPCRPFDIHRNGLTLGEAAGVLVLESADEAARGGRRPLAELSGYAGWIEAYHCTKPEPTGEGAWRVMRDCLADAGQTPDAVGCVNAHGTGTPSNDTMEALAIERLFGDCPHTLVTANKASVGHTLGAAGVVEAIFSALSLRDGVVPPTRHTQDVIPELRAGRLAPAARRVEGLDHVLSTSYGFGGTNAALLLSRWRDG